MNVAVKISDVSKRYGDILALDRVSLDIGEGELFGIIGPDGAEKSTLYRILATLATPDGGNATVCGLDTVRDYRRIRARIGYMPERFSLYPDLTVMENLKFFASLFGVSVRRNYDLIAPVFSQLERFPRRKAGALSGGMKQKLALCCALIHNPEVLFLTYCCSTSPPLEWTQFPGMSSGPCSEDSKSRESPSLSRHLIWMRQPDVNVSR